MAFDESWRVQIRMYLGASQLWQQADSRLESAITTSQSEADGGTRPDSSAENLIKSLVTELQCIDKKIRELGSMEGATAVPSGSGSVRVDAARETARQRSLGRQYVNRLARQLDTFPYADIFASAPSRATGYPNWPIGGHNPYDG